jgi:hypothetical protein
MSSNLGVCVSMKVLDVRRARAFEAQYASIVLWKGPVAFADRLMSFSGRVVRTGLERRLGLEHTGKDLVCGCSEPFEGYQGYG